MRTQQEILTRIQEALVKNLERTEGRLLTGYLEYENAKPLIEKDMKKEMWEKNGKSENTTERIKGAMYEYLVFAWDTANKSRGASAKRSVEYLAAYLWLLGVEGDLYDIINEPYQHYGKEKLIIASENVGFNWQAADDGARLDTDNDKL